MKKIKHIEFNFANDGFSYSAELSASTDLLQAW